jgi:pimeloyl-ACP methyl ester carboxylesterase
MSSTVSLILLPGLGTDAAVFAVQRIAFPQLIVPRWLPPLKRESLSDYAARMAQAANPGGPCVVGGLSFGGMVALEMTRHLDARGCVLISSLTTPRELPPGLRWLGPWAGLLPRRSDRVISLFGTAILNTLGPILPKRIRQLCVHFQKTQGTMLPWACRAATTWQPSPPWPCPVWRLHGDADPIFPLRRFAPDQVVPGGGHVLPLTHPFVVNRFLEEAMGKVVTA